MSEEERRVLECVKKWLQIKANEMEKKGEDPTKYNLYQLPADIDHSWLLERLLKGEEPLPKPIKIEDKNKPQDTALYAALRR